MGVPARRMRFVPAGATPTPSAIRFSSSSAKALAISVHLCGSSKKAICIISKASLPLIGAGSALRQAKTRPKALRLLLRRTVASCSFSGVTSWPVNSSTTDLNSLISPAHFSMSLGRFICGISMTCMGTSRPRISYAFFLPSQVVSPTYISAIRKNGQVRPIRAPTEALIKGHILFGKTCSPAGTQN